MKMSFLIKKSVRRIAVLAAVAACGALLTSCTTTPQASEAQGVFKFTVYRYTEPVEIPGWVVDRAQSSNPEGAALNIVTTMQRGDVDGWLSDWDNSERPAPSANERQDMAHNWQPLKDGQVHILGHVVAGQDMVVELTVLNAQKQAQRVQLPLKYEEHQWWLTAMDPNSEYMKWEDSPNKIVAPANPVALQIYLNDVNASHLRNNFREHSGN
jgi:hypothetical protein